MIRMLTICTFALTVSAVVGADAWAPVGDRIMTRWAAGVSPDRAWPEYPRPQLVRPQWQNLNGLWDYAIAGRGDGRPEAFDGRILVPFCVESALSGVARRIDESDALWYRRTFAPGQRQTGERVLLHFGGVDWEATVWVNGKQVGCHRGGYDPFSFDITEALTGDGEQEIVVRVWDPTDRGHQPRGKQVVEPKGIWYTPVSGIWQTVWTETVPATHVRRLKIVPNAAEATVRVTTDVAADDEQVRVELVAEAEGKKVARQTGRPGAEIALKIDNARLWTTDSPFLYDLRVRLTRGGQEIDRVDSYFALRDVGIGKDERGVLRLTLNSEPIFHYAPLDQGWWPDGLYTAPTDEALRYDLEMTRQLGFNAVRKHVKIEPARWYYWCDRMGLLVWQDMPNGNNTDAQGRENFRRELQAMIDALHNHPSIVMWVPFNEGWGQFDTSAVTEWVKQYDPTRIVNEASGWHNRGSGDVRDIHVYPGPAIPPLEEHRAAVLGEFGGLGLPIEGHTWQDKANWGYKSYESAEALTDAYVALLGQVPYLIGRGLSAAVYTQTTDVEIEVNGLMTYDRAVIKMDADRIRQANQRLYEPPPTVEDLSPSALAGAVEWKYTWKEPAPDWNQPAFEADDWLEGPAGFGRKGTPGAAIGTEWTTSDIWLRRQFDLASVPRGDPMLEIHHDEDARVYLNGVLAADLKGHTAGYVRVPVNAAAAAALVEGANTIAVHCHQTEGGQYIDVGLFAEHPAEGKAKRAQD